MDTRCDAYLRRAELRAADLRGVHLSGVPQPTMRDYGALLLVTTVSEL
jgi:hypothetical protein